MATKTTNYGSQFGYDAVMEGIHGFIDFGDYTEDMVMELGNAMLHELRAEVDERLPEDAFWVPSTSEFVHNVNTVIPSREEMREIFEEAWEQVAARYEEIERNLFGSLPATAEDLMLELKATKAPIRRARVATLLLDSDWREAVEHVRREAIRQAWGEYSQEEVTRFLGVGVEEIRSVIEME